jgi:hypothetical protein
MERYAGKQFGGIDLHRRHENAAGNLGYVQGWLSSGASSSRTRGPVACSPSSAWVTASGLTGSTTRRILDPDARQFAVANGSRLGSTAAFGRAFMPDSGHG